MSDTELLPKSKAERVRRLDVFTGAGRRRAWSGEQKDRIVAGIAGCCAIRHERPPCRRTASA